jgi:hypothetical protein
MVIITVYRNHQKIPDEYFVQHQLYRFVASNQSVALDQIVQISNRDLAGYVQIVKLQRNTGQWAPRQRARRSVVSYQSDKCERR